MRTSDAALGGIAGPTAFAAASVLAARRQPGYSPVRHHVSGLAAQGTASAPVMVPGFVALGVGQLALATALGRVGPPRGLTTLVRVAGVTTIAAGVFPASSPECPMPSDPEARPTDVRHGVASIATFLCWVAMPIVSAVAPTPASSTWPASHADRSRRLIAPSIIGMFTAGATTQARSPAKGLAQRAFLGAALTELALTALAARTADRAAPRR